MAGYRAAFEGPAGPAGKGAPRLPAEWEPQSGVMLAWPRPGGPWGGGLEAVESTFLAVAAAVSRFEPLLVVCGDAV